MGGSECTRYSGLGEKSRRVEKSISKRNFVNYFDYISLCILVIGFAVSSWGNISSFIFIGLFIVAVLFIFYKKKNIKIQLYISKSIYRIVSNHYGKFICR